LSIRKNGGQAEASPFTGYTLASEIASEIASVIASVIASEIAGEQGEE
jgi:hypothetical protein